MRSVGKASTGREAGTSDARMIQFLYTVARLLWLALALSLSLSLSLSLPVPGSRFSFLAWQNQVWSSPVAAYSSLFSLSLTYLFKFSLSISL